MRLASASSSAVFDLTAFEFQTTTETFINSLTQSHSSSSFAPSTPSLAPVASTELHASSTHVAASGVPKTNLP